MTRAADKSWQHRRMRGDDGGNKALPQTSNDVSIMQQSTSSGRREDEQRRYGNRMTAVADDDGGGRKQHARLGDGLQWRRMREGGERWRRQQSGDDGCGGGR